ncbi:uncharacterized protein LOC111463861 [Cucurbita moschata]|uniref:Uncharacterized protein LOC111463861 n=1 Tax=Cucurbita moschata TaxID=3662 RepID=A0A6J1HIC7_CUCMO|nr:uncharacterized protein LOC111463861 [Cucurbita moschata]
MCEEGNSGKRSWPELVGEDGNKAVKIIEEENPNVVVVLQAGPEIISKPLYGPDGSIIGYQAVSGRPPYAVPPGLAVVEVVLDVEGKVEKVPVISTS